MSPLNWKRQLGLALALFVLGSFAYWLEYKKKPEKEAASEQAKKVFALKDTPVESIRVSSGGKSVELHCLDFAQKQCKPGDSSKWELTEPNRMRADDANANGLVSSLANLDATDTIELQDETPEKRAALLKEYGLDAATVAAPDTRRVEVRTGSTDVALYLGATHAIGEGIFAAAERVGAGRKATGKIDETKVYVLPSYFKSSLDKDLSYWRDKKLITLASHEIEGFELKGTRAQLSGARKSGVWTLKALSGREKGEELPGDTEAVDGVLNGATFMMAKDFVSDHKDDARAKATLRGARPIVSLSLTKAGTGPVTLALYQKNDKAAGTGKASAVSPRVYATVSNLDPLFELEPFSKDRLDKDLKDLRQSKLLTSMERFQVKKLEVSGKGLGGGPLSFTMADNQWSGSGADKAALDQEKFQTLLDRLSSARIKEFAPKAPAGEDQGVRITLGGDEKQPLRRELEFWRQGGTLYARDLGSPRKDREAFRMDADLSSALPWSADFFKKGPSPETSPSAGPSPGGHR